MVEVCRVHTVSAGDYRGGGKGGGGVALCGGQKEVSKGFTYV